MDNLKEGKSFWYVDELRIKKYKILNKDNSISKNDDAILLWKFDSSSFKNTNGFLISFDKDKICFTMEEAIEMLKRDTDKLIEQIENDL